MTAASVSLPTTVRSLLPSSNLPMADLYIRNAQLTTQLARDSVYEQHGSRDDALLSSLAPGLAMQERELMQRWMDYGNAQGSRSGPSGRRGGERSSNVRPIVNQTSRTASILASPAGGYSAIGEVHQTFGELPLDTGPEYYPAYSTFEEVYRNFGLSLGADEYHSILREMSVTFEIPAHACI